MSRSGYDDCVDGWDLIRWRGAVNSAIRGKRGQALLTEMRDALDAMPVKELIARELETEAGAVCALGAVGQARRIDMATIDPEEYEHVADAFDIAPALAREIVYINDEWYWGREETAEARWKRVREWVEKQIKTDAAGALKGEE